MKKLISILLAALMVMSFASCGTANETSSSSLTDKETVSSTPEKLDVAVNVYGISGPTGIGLAPLMEKAENKTGRLNYTIALAADNNDIIAKLTNGEADIAAVATNMASSLYKKTEGRISVLAVNTLGVLSLVVKGDDTVTDIKSLKGKTIYSTGKGANPEYIINYLLEQNGLKAGEDVKIEFVSQPTELVAAFAKSDSVIAVAPQPVATQITVKDTAAKLVLNLNDEWNKVSDTKLVMGCIVARTEFIEKNPDAVKIFLEEYKESIETVNNNIDKAAELCAKYKIVAAAPIAKKAIPNCNIVFEAGKDMKTDLSAYLKFLFDKNPQSVGGALPADDFYYEAK